MTRVSFICALALLGAVACDDRAEELEIVQDQLADATSASRSSAEPLEITWEQLMPAGEEERLAELYANYYQQLNQQMGVGSDSGGDSGNAGELVSTIAEGSASDTMDQVGTFNVVEEFNGKTVRLPGYPVPFDFSAEATYQEFLLVPYFGACLHTPPPPPNQIVFVKAKAGASIKDIYEPIWVEGVLKTGEFSSDLASTAYELTLDKVEVYEY